MSNDPVDGGTVTYHRAEWIGEKIKPVYPWMVQFVEDGPIHELTRAEGEAMGLTPPEPAPLVVTCNGHSIDVPEWELDDFIAEWGEDGVEDYSAGSNRLATRFAYWLRDARQDPQPASDEGLEVLVRRPAPLSPGECLRGLLAGRDDADELIEYAKQWGGRGLTPDGRWRAVIGDAARLLGGGE